MQRTATIFISAAALGCQPSADAQETSGEPGSESTDATGVSEETETETTDTGDSGSDGSETGPAGTCGDGLIDAGEQCDDGEQNGEYGACNTSCDGPGPHCGDGMLSGLEQCDDGDDDGLDGCSNLCETHACGDGVAQAGDLCFSPFVEHPLAFDPGPMLSVDLNGDGHLDLVVGDVTGDEIFVALGDGTGELAAGTAEPGPQLVHQLFAEDFDDDGNLDVLAVGRQLGFVVLLGDGLGGLSVAATSVDPLESATATDLDLDGRADLVVGHDGSTEIFLGIGDGNFTLHDTMVHNDWVTDWSISTDLDGDAQPDLIVAVDESSVMEPKGEVWTFAGLGNADLSPLQTFDLADDAERVLVAELNGDTLPDVLVLRGGQACAGADKLCGGVQWRHPTLGELTAFVSDELEPGTIAQASSVVVGYDPSDIAASDLDSDGAVDVVVCHFAFGWLDFLRGDGLGGLSGQTVDAVGFRHVEIELADLNEDGVDDLLLSRAALGNQAGSVRIRLSDP